MNERNQQGARRQGTAAPIQGRRWVRDSLFTVLGMTMALSLSASAEWQVQDEGTRNKLDTANKHLERIEQVGSGSYQSDAEAGSAQGQYKAPEVAFESKNIKIDVAPKPKSPLGVGTASGLKISAVDMNIDMRCSKPSPPSEGISEDLKNKLKDKLKEKLTGGAQSIADQQFQVCREIVETQQARFKYNVMMSELAAKRYERLKELQQARGKIDGNAVGLLQDNTNAILGLIAQTHIDQQQRAAYNDIYESRLVYLEGVQQRLSQRTLDGKPNVAVELIAMAGLAASLGVDPTKVIPKL
ncbi:hypothetical protein EBB59_08600 [Lysobacter pythonis]|uniref:Uncharacterized protein n=1 Tax=Solilutibacter pythonis TaxID=2483112 RepID=A0A3M2HPP7_9GAMM|nr:hypothetical protein [Lysobacter pythonis]RMH90998.1 hypothetical protein EBB59_08600 [Lysobacter pythonis]